MPATPDGASAPSVKPGIKAPDPLAAKDAASKAIADQAAPDPAAAKTLADKLNAAKQAAEKLPAHDPNSALQNFKDAIPSPATAPPAS